MHRYQTWNLIENKDMLGTNVGKYLRNSVCKQFECDTSCRFPADLALEKDLRILACGGTHPTTGSECKWNTMKAGFPRSQHGLHTSSHSGHPLLFPAHVSEGIPGHDRPARPIYGIRPIEKEKMPTTRESLGKLTKIVADTGDLDRLLSVLHLKSRRTVELSHPQ